MMVTSFTDASFDLLGFNVQSLAHCDAVGEGGIHSIILTFQHVSHGLAEVGLARDALGLGRQPGEELIDQRARPFLPDSPTTIRV